MPPADVLPQIQADAIRIAKLDPSGVPLPGAGNLYVTDALTVLTLKPVYLDGTEITEANASGKLCLDYRGDDSFRRVDVEIEVCEPDPYLEHLLSGAALLDLGGDVPPGSAAPAIGPLTANAVSIEVWAKRINDGDLDADYPYAWWALPKIRNLRTGDKKLANEANKPTFTGQGLQNPNWYDGPNNDWPSASDRAWQWVPTTAATIPAVTSGLQTLPAS